MRRRAFIAALGGAVALPLAGRAQQDPVRRIGVLLPSVADSAGRAIIVSLLRVVPIRRAPRIRIISP